MRERYYETPNYKPAVHNGDQIMKKHDTSKTPRDAKTGCRHIKSTQWYHRMTQTKEKASQLLKLADWFAWVPTTPVVVSVVVVVLAPLLTPL
jgi:hypothetical protein